MQIQSTGNSPAGKLTETISLESANKTSGRTDAKAAENPQSALTGYAPTADLARLLATVRELPDVREDLVREASNRVASGELFTPQAANEAAIAAADDLR